MQVVFPKLETLHIESLNIRKTSIFRNNTSFPQLDSLALKDLPNLERFCGGDISFPQLESLILEHLPNLQRFCGGDISFPQLKSLRLEDLPNLQRFCGGDISFPQLKYLRLEDLPNLQRFCGRDCVDCPFLSTLAITDCLKLRVSITEKEDENSRSSVDKHLSHYKVILICFS